MFVRWGLGICLAWGLAAFLTPVGSACHEVIVAAEQLNGRVTHCMPPMLVVPSA